MDIEKIITDFKSGKRIEGEGLLLEYKDFSKSNLTPGDLGNKIIMLISSLHNQPTNIQKAAYLIIGYDETLGKPVHNKKNIVSVEDIQKKIYDSLSKTVGISDITQSFTEKEGITVIRVNTRDNNILAEIKKGKYNGKTFIRVNSENMPNSEWWRSKDMPIIKRNIHWHPHIAENEKFIEVYYNNEFYMMYKREKGTFSIINPHNLNYLIIDDYKFKNASSFALIRRLARNHSEIPMDKLSLDFSGSSKLRDIYDTEIVVNLMMIFEDDILSVFKEKKIMYRKDFEEFFKSKNIKFYNESNKKIYSQKLKIIKKIRKSIADTEYAIVSNFQNFRPGGYKYTKDESEIKKWISTMISKNIGNFNLIKSGNSFVDKYPFLDNEEIKTLITKNIEDEKFIKEYEDMFFNK